MPDETTSNPAPVDTVIPQTPETQNATAAEPVATIQAEIPAVIASAPAEVFVEQVFTPESAETQQAPSIVDTAETPVTMAEPAPIETVTPEMPEVVSTEIIQPTPTESVVEVTTPQTIVAETFATVPVSVPTPTITETEATPAVQVEIPVLPPASEIQSGQTSTNDPIAQAPVAPTMLSVSAPFEAAVSEKSMSALLAKEHLAVQKIKEKKLGRIMGLFMKKALLTNDDVEKFLHVSDSTATRYFATLEKKGKIKQGGKKGSGVSYIKI